MTEYKREGPEKDSTVGQQRRGKCRNAKRAGKKEKETQGKQIRQALDLILSR